MTPPHRSAEVLVAECPTAERVQRQLERAATAASVVVACVGMAGLASLGGLMSGVDVRLGSAANLVLAALALAATARRWNVAARSLSLAVVVVAAWSPAHLMTPCGSIGFGLVAIAMLALAGGRVSAKRTFVAAGASLIAITLGALALTVYAMGIPVAFGLGLHSWMSAHTAVSMCVLGLGVLAAAVRCGAASGIPARRWLPVLTAASMAGATIIMCLAIVEHDRRVAESAARRQAEVMARELSRRSVDRARLLDRLSSRFANERSSNLAAWALSVREWERDYPGMQGLGWSDASSTQRWSEPMDATAFALRGTRLDSDERIAATLRRAAELRSTQATEPFGVGTSRVSLLLISSIPHGGRITGYLSSRLDLARYLDDVFSEDIARGYAFAVHDGASLLYEQRRAHEAPADRWQVAVPVQAMGRRWVLTATPTEEVLASVSSAVPIVLLVGGLLCAALLGWIVLVLQRSREISLRLGGVVHELADENAARRESEHMRAALVHSTLDGVAAFDASGCVSAWNPRMAALTGRAEADVDGRMIEDMVSFLPSGTEGQMLIDALTGRRTQLPDVCTMHPATGEEIWLDVSVTPMRSADGRTLGGLLVARDITARKRLADVVLAGKLAAEEANRAKSDFLARMSHELRTPLNAVIGFTNVLRRNRHGRLERDEITYLERINANGRHLLGLINEILDLAKIESGKESAELEPVSIAALVRDTLADLDVRASGASVRLHAVLPTGMLDAHTDEAKLKQVLINLIGNAIKFTPHSGRVTVSVSIDQTTGHPTRIDVADTGVGIPPERLGAIFEAFEQADTDTTRRFGGTGLGLAIARSLCALMGHELVVRSALGVGSTFSIVLSNARQAQAAA